MTATTGVESENYQILDSDGHVREDLQGVASHLPPPYADAYQRGDLDFQFPPLDHFHSFTGSISPSQGRGPVGPPEWMTFLKDVGIEKTVLYPTWALAYGKITNTTVAIATCMAYNDWIAETYLDYDRNCFKAMAIVPLQDPAAAVIELERAVSELGMTGVMLPSHGLPLHLGSPAYWSVYEAANRLHCPIATHGGCHDGFGFDDMNMFAPVHAMGHPFGQVISLAGMLFNGFFERFPNIRVAFLEGGVSWLLMALERFDESYESHVALDVQETSWLSNKDVNEYLVDLIASGRIFLGCEGGERDLKYVVENVAPNALMYSSDFPHEVTAETCRAQLGKLNASGLSQESIRGILRDNALKFYQL